MTAFAADHGQERKPSASALATCVRSVSEVTTPKLPPPPRRAQKRSGSCCSSHVSTFPSAVATPAAGGASQVRAHTPDLPPVPPPSAGPANPPAAPLPPVHAAPALPGFPQTS